MYPNTYSGQLKEFVRLRQLLTFWSCYHVMFCYVVHCTADFTCQL